MLFATRRDPGCINDFSEFPGGTAKVGRMKLLMGKERLDVSENEKSVRADPLYSVKPAVMFERQMARPMRLFPSLLPLARGPHLHLLESTSGAKLLCGRVALPEETLLPRLRRMDPTSLRSTGSEVPSEKLVFKKGISTFIDRGFAPSSGDFSRIMGADIPEKGRSLRSGLKILEKNPAQSGDKEDKSDILAPKPFFKHQAVELQPPDRRQHRLDHYLVPALGQYEQHLRLASAAEWLKDSVEQAVGLKVNRSRAIHKETISTVAPRPKNRRPSLQSRCVARTILPPPRLPQEEEHYVASLQANTPAPSHIASASESSTRSGSEVNLFVAETVRTATAKAIAASRRGAIMPIIDGELQQQSSTYQSFREKAGPARWGKVEWILEQIQNLCMEFAVPYADIMCEAVLDLTVPETRTQVSRDELASCAVNSVEVYLLVHAAGQRYRGRDGKQAAATKIQATFRMWIMRRIHVWYLDRVWATNVFIKHWNRRKLRFSHRRKSNAQYITVHLKRYQRLQSTLKRTFDSLMSRKRVIIQLVPSKQLGDLNQFPDVSVGRTILLSNPDVELVFVTPYLDEDRIKYYTRIIGAGFPERNPMDQNRLNFVIPEAARCFPSTAPIAAALIASQRALNRLKKICTGKNAIFMCDIVGEAEVTLSSTLSIPIFGPTPDAYAQHLSTRSRAREFLKSCQVPVAPALEVHARSEDELSLHIVKAISMFSEVPVWTLHRDPFIRKLDGTERDGPDAYVDAGLLTFVQKLWEPLARKTYAVSDRPSTSQMEIHNVSEAPSSSSDAGVFRPMTAPALHDLERPMTPRRGMIAAHLTIAQREIPLHVRMVAAGVSWSDMLKAWRRSGGLVQGFPTKDARDTTLIEIGIMLGFDGQFQVIVMSEALLQRASFSPSILIIPQSQTWGDIKQGLSTHLPAITAQCASRGIVGLLSLQFWRWKDPTTNKLKFWATSIRPHLTPNLLRAATVLLATGCRTDSSDWNAKFFLKDVPMRIRHAGNVRWIDQGKVQDAFHHKRVPNISIHEPRVAVYLFGLEHGQVALMTQAAAVAVASNNGLGYDEMTRMGNLFPHKDATWQGGFPMVIVGARYDKVLENSLTSLLRFKKLFDEVARVSGARYRSNFMSTGTRLLYELLRIKAIRFPTADLSQEPSPIIQAALKELGVVVPAAARFSRVQGSAPSRPRIPDNIPVRAAKDRDPDDSDSEPEESLIDYIDLSPRLSRPTRAQSATLDTLTDFEKLLSYFMTIPMLPPSRPGTVESMEAEERQARKQRRQKKRPRRAFSPVTVSLLAEEVPSDMAAKFDDTFHEPQISPPFSRKASAARIKMMDGRSKRARVMLEKMESELEERWKKEFQSGEDPNKPMSRLAKKKLERAAVAAGTAGSLDKLPTRSPALSTLKREPSIAESDDERLTEDDNSYYRVDMVPEESPLVEKGDSPRSLNTHTDGEERIDMNSVLLKLKDLAERGNRISDKMEEKTKEGQKRLEESHKLHLELLEQKKSEEEARAAQLEQERGEAELAAARGKFVGDQLLAANDSTPGTIAFIRRNHSPMRTSKSHQYLSASEGGERSVQLTVDQMVRLPRVRNEANKITIRRVSDLVTDIMADMFAKERETTSHPIDRKQHRR